MQDENKPVANEQPVAGGIAPEQPAAQTSVSPATTPPPTENLHQSLTTPPKRKKESGAFSFIATLAIAFVLVQVINMFFFQSYKVFGSSMFPTLHDGDRLIISKVGRTGAKLRGKDYVPKRGDIVVFVDPQRDDLQLIKRVIGLPGERVVVKNGEITVYNSENPEGFNPDESGAYKADLPEDGSGDNDVRVPDTHIFVSGDNRSGSNSLDSRNSLGTVPEELIVGTLKVRLFPFDSAKFF